jgi:acyl transferase domain-containing protein/surfactin synthase thioesterase subunit/NADPH:quinone reductase-like Zn-dependent oxidoreductase
MSAPPAKRPPSTSPGIAVVGIACRFPGCADVDAFRRLLLDGVDAVREVPADRAWPVREEGPSWGGFLDEIAEFDASFFGVSALEAASMDPQHRVLLEVAWEAMESAGIVRPSARSTCGGVWIGIGHSDYASLGMSEPEELTAFASTGVTASLAPNRLSQLFDLRGPSLAIDTGCSSSAVAAHLACESLARGEVDLALAGGVSAILLPGGMVALERAWMTAPDGRCKSFDAAADGYVRGEGCGVIVLKRLEDAQRDGDRVLAVIRGSAIGHDGRRRGLTVPAASALTSVIRRALARAGVEPREIDYVEAHGVGSLVSDAAELVALGTALGPRAEPCPIGSVKTNIGHLEWASGVAGLIKLLVAFDAEALPPHLHFRVPSPALPRDVVRVVTSREAWPRRHGPRRAGLNSFGLGGTNVHLVVEEAPRDLARPEAAEKGAPPHLFSISAKSPEALCTLARRHAARLATIADHELGDYTRAVLTDRARFEHRLALPARSVDALSNELAHFAAGERREGIASGIAADAPRLAFLFTGQGSQLPGMGRGLYETEPVFRRALDECDALLRRHRDASLLATIYPPEGATSAIHDTTWTQPALFAFEYAMAETWASWGVRPAMMLGHSVGEYVAACLAGVFTLEEGLELIELRARLMGSLPPGGRMAAVFASEERVREAVAPYEDRVAIAAVNGPAHVVISGARDAVDAVVDALDADFVMSQPLEVSHAFHSALMAPMLEEFERRAARIHFSKPSIPIASNVTGALFGSDDVPNAAYFRRHLRGTVRFADGIRALAGAGATIFLEIGPSDTLSKMGAHIVGKAGPSFVPSLKRGRDDRDAIANALAQIFVHGIEIEATRGPRFDLPTYPFQRRRHWLPTKALPSSVPPPSLDALVRREVAELLGHEPDEVRGFFDQGMDSLRAVALHDRLQRAIGGGVALPPTLVFDHPTVGDLGAACARLVSGSVAPAPRLPISTHAAAPGGPIAVIGIGCRFPGAASDPERFWRILEDGVDAITEVPRDRWDVDAVFDPDPDAPGKTYARWGGFIENVAEFDPRFFGMSPREAAAMDPQQRLALEVTWEALARAGQPKEMLAGSSAGVFMGAIGNEYVHHILEAGDAAAYDAHAAIGNLGSALSGRISHFFGLRGPCLTVDAACASSLVTVHLACRSLRERECRLAIAGGVNLLLRPEGSMALSRARALAADGRCKTFDAAADGYVRAEGAGVVILKRLEDARADGDPILALIRGSAMNHDGHASGFTVPSGPAQQALIAEALADAGVEPHAIDYVETHGTGTSLGDPIEVASLAAVLSRGRAARQPLLLGSVKTNIGHLEAAAGIAGLVKLVLALGRGIIPPHLHFQRVNPRIALDAIPGAIPTEPTPWPRRGRPRLGAVSSFGMTGTNAHVIVEEPPAAAPSSPEAPGPFLLLLSARSPDALRSLASAFHAHLSAERIVVSLADVCFTAARRRTHHDHRAAILASSRRDLLSRLEALASASVEVPTPIHDAPASLEDAASLWAARAPVDLATIFPVGRVVDLPPHPFTRQRCWIDSSRTRRSQQHRSALPASSALESASPPDPDDWLHAIHWVEAPACTPAGAEPQGKWVVLSDVSDVGELLAQRLSRGRVRAVLALAGERCARVHEHRFEIRAGDPRDTGWLLETVGAEGALLGVVHLQPIDAREPRGAGEAADAFAAAQRTTCDVVAELVRRLSSTRGEVPALVMVTRGGQATGALGETVNPIQAVAWGVGRSVMHEHPELGCTMIDLDPSGAISAAVVDALAADLEARSRERQIAYRDGRRLVPRIARSVLVTPSPSLSPRGEGAYRLETARPGFLSDLRFASVARRAPGPGEIEIRVRAMGLSFLDAMKAAALLPRHASGPTPLGLEAAGTVITVGPGEARFAVGDEVIAFAPEGARSHVTLPAALAIHRPRRLDAAQAVTVPLAFLVARYALLRRAELAPGERVLIHSAAGGVGLAAIQEAWRAGAEVLATAGNETRREFLRRLGIAHVFDSRTLQFVEGVRAATDGAGVDVVLSSIAGHGVEAGLSLLRPHGRLVDISRRDEARMLDGPPTASTLSLLTVDVERLLDDRRAVAADLLAEIHRDLENGAIEPLLARTFPVTRLDSAVRSLLYAKEIGKVVLTIDDAEPVAVAASAERPAIRADGTYLITGGLGALGLRVAAWLVGEGARHVTLVGRNAPSAVTEAAIAAMRAGGANVVTARADVGDAASMARLLADLDAAGVALRGVVHAAGVLDDGVLAELHPARFSSVLAPKAIGAYVLHALTLGLPLDFFVLFSSGASMLGSPGQANYAGANAYLDALAHARRAAGLPATSIGWGPWSDVGMATQPGRTDNYERRGVGTIAPEQGLALLGRILAAQPAHVGVLPVSFRRYATLFPGMGQSPLFDALLGGDADLLVAGSGPCLAVPDLPPEERRAAVVGRLREATAEATGLALEQLDPTAALAELGLDSLAAVTLRARMRERLGMSLALREILGAASLDDLAARLLGSIGGEAPRSHAAAPSAARVRAKEAKNSDFVVELYRSSRPRVRLFCFPYAGGGAAAFHRWPEGLPDDIDVYAIQPPGRGAHLHEPPFTRMEQLVTALLPALLARLDAPFAFLGHCMGALVMFEVSRRLRALRRSPIRLFVSGSPAPLDYFVPRLDQRSRRYVENSARAHPSLVPVHALPDADLADVLRFLNFRPTRALLEDAELAKEMLPTVRADFEICDRYVYAEEAPLDCPMTAFAGEEDPFAPPSRVARWRALTSASFDLHERPGDHYFLVPERETMTRVIVATLAG